VRDEESRKFLIFSAGYFKASEGFSVILFRWARFPYSLEQGINPPNVGVVAGKNARKNATEVTAVPRSVTFVWPSDPDLLHQPSGSSRSVWEAEALAEASGN
jgi:hypothetical protein